MRHVGDLRGFLPLEQQQPAIQVVGQHHDLEPVGIHHPALGGVRRQAGVVIRFLDQVLGRGSAPIESHQCIQWRAHVGDEDPIGVLRRIEQLVLFGLFRLAGIRLLFIPQGQEPVWYSVSSAQRLSSVGPRLLGLVPAEEPQARRRRQLTKRAPWPETLRGADEKFRKMAFGQAGGISRQARREPISRSTGHFAQIPGHPRANQKLWKTKNLMWLLR